MAKSKVVYSPREVIEGKLLVALTEDDKCAIVMTRQELDDLIDVFMGRAALKDRQREMMDDLITLRDEAFGKGK